MGGFDTGFGFGLGLGAGAGWVTTGFVGMVRKSRMVRSELFAVVVAGGRTVATGSFLAGIGEIAVPDPAGRVVVVIRGGVWVKPVGGGVDVMPL